MSVEGSQIQRVERGMCKLEGKENTVRNSFLRQKVESKIEVTSGCGVSWLRAANSAGNMSPFGKCTEMMVT